MATRLPGWRGRRLARWCVEGIDGRSPPLVKERLRSAGLLGMNVSASSGRMARVGDDEATEEADAGATESPASATGSIEAVPEAGSGTPTVPVAERGVSPYSTGGGGGRFRVQGRDSLFGVDVDGWASRGAR